MGTWNFLLPLRIRGMPLRHYMSNHNSILWYYKKLDLIEDWIYAYAALSISVCTVSEIHVKNQLKLSHANLEQQVHLQATLCIIKS